MLTLLFGTACFGCLLLSFMLYRMLVTAGKTKLDQNYQRFRAASDYAVKETRPWE